ncbi:MAG: FecR domain-containing protein [Puia sp.]|nr:FecR domain-containing protein [Puia sp.]
MEKRSRLAILFSKLSDNACTPDEVDELILLLSNERQDPSAVDVLNDRLSAPEVPGEVDEAVRQRLQKGLGRILSAGQEPMPVKSRLRVLSGRFLKYAAVLVFLFAGVAGGSLLLFSSIRKKAMPARASRQPLENDVAPGYSKAILTLGNGHQIVLDSACNGLLVEQGNTKVLKLRGGELAYNAPGGTSGGNSNEDGDENDENDGNNDGETDNIADKNTAGKNTKDVVYNTLTTPAGGQYRLTLPDGTRVWLDASSSIVYPTVFAGDERKVEVRGQAYFETVKNEKKPFIVQCGAMMVQVLGTGFNINAYEDEAAIRTTLLEGAVKVVAGGHSEVLDPGQQAQLNKRGGINVVRADVDETVAWKNGFFSFRHADIQTVMRQLCRWYDVSVKYEGAVSKEGSFSGEIGRNLSLKDVLNGLQLSRIHYRIEADKKLVILP